ncbi:unnamed protein product [Calicophoron daubneyi]|uniref:Uncharacterized protein n=1 Tax=Calicophoron daubneyi TaxID=300641 RepID=A0AAV2TTF1_CALDB
MDVGGMPPEVISSPNLMKTFDQNNPVDKYSKIYLDPISLHDTVNHSTMVNLTCDVVSRQRRSSLYRILQQWIRFAEKSKIMWWLSCGTLLGAVR